MLRAVRPHSADGGARPPQQRHETDAMNKRSAAALAAFVFGCALATTTALATDACQTCWNRYNKCLGTEV
jgi:hypothetical protein